MFSLQFNWEFLYLYLQVFNQDAELEGISSAPISVSRIKHASLVEVFYHNSSLFTQLPCPIWPNFAQATKEGREGAAARGEEIFSAAVFGEQKDVVVDRPFIFVVQDKKNKIPLLVGKVADPTQMWHRWNPSETMNLELIWKYTMIKSSSLIWTNCGLRCGTCV